MEFVLDPGLPPRRFVPRSRFERPGLSSRNETRLNAALSVLVVVFTIGWSYAIYRAVARGEPSPLLAGTVTASPLAPDAPPEIAFLLDAAMRLFVSDELLRGRSGAVNVVVTEQGRGIALDSLPAGVQLRYTEGADTVTAPQRPGVWNVLLAMREAIRPASEMTLITLVPLAEKRAGRIGEYLIGTWPYEAGGEPRSPAYAPPAGLIRVTPENLDTKVSEHFTLGDFLTKGQVNVWPKYVAMSPRLLDKLELTIQELRNTGTPVAHVGVISGFRTPRYNEAGGNPAGRGALSRHMYGDAMDFYIDNDRDGRMDDLNGDGRINSGDGRVMVKAATTVEKKYPELVGGIGLYAPTGAHSGFIHVDTRGFRARWGGA
ncbi:MAG: YcbK family protein [Gemmatimonadota bacterium]